MLRVLLPSLLLLAAALPVVSAADADIVDPCTRYTVCPIVHVGDGRACAGLGFGLQGVAACGDSKTGCAYVIYGFNRETVCTSFDVTLP